MLAWHGTFPREKQKYEQEKKKKTTGDLHTYTGAREKGYVLGLMRLLVALPKILKGRPILEGPKIGAVSGRGSVVRQIRSGRHHGPRRSEGRRPEAVCGSDEIR